MATVPINPTPFLNSLCGENVVVRLKWGMEYRGALKAVDNYMNLQLLNAEEWKDGACAAQLGEILIRCNNVLYVRGTNDAAKEPPEKRSRGASAMDERE